MMNIIWFFKRLRDLWYKHIVWHKYKIGKNFHCGRETFMWAKNHIEIGDNFYFGKFSTIETDCIIGNNVIIANYVGIVGRHDHDYKQVGVSVRLSQQIRDKGYKRKTEYTIIGDDVWIGFGSIIMSGVNIASGSIIAAGSVVTHNTEPYNIYAGVPARKIRSRFDSEADLEKHINMAGINIYKGGGKLSNTLHLTILAA